MLLFEDLHEALLRRHVQHIELLVEERSLLLKINRDEAMALQRQTRRTQGVRPGIDATVRKKLAVMMFTNGALHGVACIKDTQHLEPDPAKPEEVFTGYVAYQQGDEPFHGRKDSFAGLFASF